MKRFILFFIILAIAIPAFAVVKFIYDLDEPHLIGTWGVYEASSSNLPIKFVFGEEESFIYEPGWYGDLTSKKYLAFIIGGSTTGKFTLHFVGSAAYGLNGFEYGWRNFVVHSFNGSELEISDYNETFTLKLRKDYEPIYHNPKDIESVDLGLSVLWAKYNLGASNPYESGNYYAWGETTTKSIYDESTYKVDWNSLPDQISSTQYDPAHVELGHGWHLPTFRNFLELVNECQWEYSESDHGYYVTGPNGNQIFFILAGGKEGDHYVGYLPDLYWSQGFYMSGTKGSDPMYNNYLLIDTQKHGLYQYLATRGQTVRPVKESTNRAPIISKDPEGTVNVYNLAGQLEFINVPVKDLQEVLPKGLHVINGQKLLIE